MKNKKEGEMKMYKYKCNKRQCWICPVGLAGTIRVVNKCWEYPEKLNLPCLIKEDTEHAEDAKRARNENNL
jgi:hypothetical protein